MLGIRGWLRDKQQRFRLWCNRETYHGCGVLVGSFITEDGSRLVSMKLGKSQAVLTPDGADSLAKQLTEWALLGRKLPKLPLVQSGLWTPSPQTFTIKYEVKTSKKSSRPRSKRRAT